MAHANVRVHRLPILDLAALGALLAIALSAGGSWLRDDVFIYGDHPGHYWVLWYTLNVAA